MSEHTAPRRKLPWPWHAHAHAPWLLFTSALLLAACGGGLVPVHNIQNAPVVVARGQTATAPHVRDAIVRALGSRNWQLNREGPEGIVATTIVGGHSATIRIQYDEHTYSIQHVDSSPGLRFNGQGIQRNYNNWVEKLNRSIRSLLMGPQWGGVQVVITPPPPASSPAAEPAPATAAPAVAPPAKPSGPTYDDAPPPPPPAAPHP